MRSVLTSSARQGQKLPSIPCKYHFLFSIADCHLLDGIDHLPEIPFPQLRVKGIIRREQEVLCATKLISTHQGRCIPVDGCIVVKHSKILNVGLAQSLPDIILQILENPIVRSDDPFSQERDHASA